MAMKVTVSEIMPDQWFFYTELMAFRNARSYDLETNYLYSIFESQHPAAVVYYA